MNTPSPLIPQGALPSTRGKSHIRIAIISILAVHVVLLLALLMAGCKKTSDQAKNDAPGDLTPTFDPNSLPVATNPPTPPPSNTASALVTPSPMPASFTTTPATPAVTSFDGTEHVVVKGDNFFDLSKKYHVSLAAIKASNPGVDSSKLQIGQKLKIPAVSAMAATPAGVAN